MKELYLVKYKDASYSPIFEDVIGVSSTIQKGVDIVEEYIEINLNEPITEEQKDDLILLSKCEGSEHGTEFNLVKINLNKLC